MKDNTRLTLKYYWQHINKYRWLLFFTLFGTIMAAGADVIVPLFYKKFFDALTVTSDIEKTAGVLITILISIAILQFFHWLGWRISTVANIDFESKVLRNLSNTCFEYLHKHSYSYFNNNFVGTLVKRVNYFVRAFEAITDRVVYDMIPLFVNITVAVTVLFIKNRVLGLIALGWAAVFLTFNWFLTHYKLKFDIQRSEAESEVTGHLADTVTNNTNVKLFNGYLREVKTFFDKNEKLRKIRRFSWNLDALIEATQSMLMLALEIGTMYYGIKLWKLGQFTIGDFVLLQSYVLIVFSKIWSFGRIIRQVYQNLADAEEMTVMLKTPHEIIDAPKAKKLKTGAGQIEFEKVNFYYNESNPVLSNFNLIIKPKEKVALVGPSGAGKTTITRLILRMYNIPEGKVLIDGQDISQVKLESLWENISLVPQDPILFHRSLSENIAYGKPGATQSEIEEAAKQAHAHEFITKFPEGYSTFVGERGVKLSGGERQRVAIARAILRNAPILILDEATSSLDSESEKLIQEALDNLMKNKTVIIVAHRLSTIMKSDRILVIDNGGIVEEGTHTDLLKKDSGIYKNLWSIQAGGFIK